MNYLGNKEILKLHKTGFVSSRKCSAATVLKSYDWAKEQREAGKCIVCGNHSQIEKDVFEILLRGKQALIMVLHRGMKKQWENDILDAVNQNRLLIISPFDENNTRSSRTNAKIKNKTIIDLSDDIVIGYKTPGEQLDELLSNEKYKTLQ